MILGVNRSAERGCEWAAVGGERFSDRGGGGRRGRAPWKKTRAQCAHGVGCTAASRQASHPPV
eukprot:scaffold16985_cov102-Isochrysis_galbana.AAC.2